MRIFLPQISSVASYSISLLFGALSGQEEGHEVGGGVYAIYRDWTDNRISFLVGCGWEKPRKCTWIPSVPEIRNS